MESSDGYVDLQWQASDGSRTGLFLLSESGGRADRSVFVEGGATTVFLSEPGAYSYTIQSCRRDVKGVPECGRKSKKLTLRVKDHADANVQVSATSESLALGTASAGPAQLRPGLWYDPNRPGHGFSFYWANRQALPESHDLYGQEYDLVGVWYTFEAKSVLRDENGLLVRADYQPLVVRLRLVQAAAGEYAGGAYVTRNGKESLVGGATVTFGTDNSQAKIEWSVDFKFERLASRDSLVFLAGPDSANHPRLSHFAGIWSGQDNDGVALIADFGYYSEAYELLFEDAFGDPTWAQAVNTENLQAGSSYLCFYYVENGYAPDKTGNIRMRDLGCDRSQSAGYWNRNGARSFEEFELMDFWASIDLPAGRGRLAIGSRDQPAQFQKTGSFHRIQIVDGTPSCEITGGSCDVRLAWFTDGYYPEASIHAHRLDTGESTRLIAKADPISSGRTVSIHEPGTYRFELRMGANADSTVIAHTSEFAASSSEIAAPNDVSIRWLDEPRQEFRVEWRHEDPASTGYFELEETPPGSSAKTYVVQPAATAGRDFSYAAGPFGEYGYRVRACGDTGSATGCSSWSDRLTWQVSQSSGGAPDRPWSQWSAGANNLVRMSGMHYAMGYHFQPISNGTVTELGGLFGGAKVVRLFDRETGEQLAETVVSSNGEWQYAPISAVDVRSDRTYTVAVYLAGGSGYYSSRPGLPVDTENVRILASTYAATGSNRRAVPTNETNIAMYGQADIGFVAGGTGEPKPPPGSGPANPEQPPEPASRPGFREDLSSTAVGAISGEGFVDSQGAANYRVPLRVAPGSGGFAPKIGLAYSSLGGNGPLGVGWSIDGTSSISRCPQTREHDAVMLNEAVALDEDDRFCLDGRRLLAVSGGYGDDGTEYRLEFNGTWRIRSHGRAGKGPAWFEVFHGDGSISRYGGNDDSRVEARVPGDNDTVLTWALDRTQDSAGNYIDFVYAESSSGFVEHVLEAVRYTGNVHNGVEPWAEIRFHYTSGRSDTPISRWLGGTYKNSKLLTRIDSLAKGRAGDRTMASLRSWFLEYGQDGFGRKVLESLEECSDARKTACHEPTRFEWLKNESRVSEQGLPVGDVIPTYVRGLGLADVNGDGRQDLLMLDPAIDYRLRIGFGQEDGTFLPGSGDRDIPRTEPGGAPVSLLAIDANADGYQDVMYPRPRGSSTDWVVRLSTIDGFGDEIVVAVDCCGHLEPEIASVIDYNGDGLADVLTHKGIEGATTLGDLVVLVNGSSPGGAVAFEEPLEIGIDNWRDLFSEDPSSGWRPDTNTPRLREIASLDEAGVQPMDFNGDGAVDLLVRLEKRYTRCGNACGGEDGAGTASASATASPDDEQESIAFYVVLESDAKGRFARSHVVARDAASGCNLAMVCEPWTHLPLVDQLVPVDINADGLADLAYQDGNGNWSYIINSGAGFLPGEFITTLRDERVGSHVRFSDFTGDGYPEFLYPSDVGSRYATWIIHTNDPAMGFGSAEATSIPFGYERDGDTGVMSDFNGDGSVDYLFLDFRFGRLSESGTRLYRGVNLIGSRTHEPRNVVTAVEDGFGKRLEFEYAPLTDPGVYTRLSNASFANWGPESRVFDLVGPVFVVQSMSTSAPGMGNPTRMIDTAFHYVGAKVQAGGRGFLGFSEIVRWEAVSRKRVNTLYRQDAPFTGQIADTITVLASTGTRHFSFDARNAYELRSGNASAVSPGGDVGGALISHTANEWTIAQREGLPLAERSSEIATTWNVDGDLLSKTVVDYRRDALGRLTESVKSIYQEDGRTAVLTMTTRNEFGAVDQSSWNLHGPARTAVLHERPGKADIVRTTAFTHDPSTGLLLSEIIEPDRAKFRVESRYTLDSFGNRLRTEVRGADIETRVSRMEYDNLGRFAVEEINPYGQRTMHVNEWNAQGASLSASDIDGVRTFSADDVMGRVFGNWTETGSWEQVWKREGIGSLCPSSTVFHERIEKGGQPTMYRCLDALEREVRKVTAGFNGNWIFVDTEFDAQGRPVRVSEPYFQGGTRYWTVSEFDLLGRMLRVDSAEGNELRMRYGNDAGNDCGVRSPFAVDTVNALGQRQTVVSNALGEKVAVYDEYCGVTAFEYDAIGNLVEVTGPSGSRHVMTYDLAGRKTMSDDPDKGAWRYAWNVLSEMTRQLDAKGQAMDYEHDRLGRVVLRSELSGVQSLDDSVFRVEHVEETQWQNGTASGTKGKGQPLRVTYTSGQSGATVHSNSYEYDEFGRIMRTVTTIGDLTFTEEKTYDQFGRTFQEFDASGDSRGLRYRYNQQGYLDQLAEAREGESGVVYRDIEALDARGNVAYAVLGNGVEVFASRNPVSGALTTLEAYGSDGREIQRVEYEFDDVGNLRERADSSAGADFIERFDYDGLNRLVRIEMTAPGQGVFTPTETLALDYDASGNITYKSDVGSYRYGEHGAGPHAVTSAGGSSYSYDANGNQLTGDGRTISYSVFDKAERIARDGRSTQFSYGIAHRRVQRVDEGTPEGTVRTTYTGGAEFIETASETWFRRSLAGIAVQKVFPGSGQAETRYVVRDHLGSVHNVTDESGEIGSAAWAGFDAFGQRRSADGLSALPSSGLRELEALGHRGFTGHEHVDDMGLIHMNGRLYDPVTGRFLQADPLVQSPSNSQALNRYSYVLNNPLSHTDPSGYFIDRLIKRWGRLIVAIVLSVVLPGTNGVLSGMGITGPYVQAGITGFVTGAIVSGTFKGAVIGAVTGLAVQWATSTSIQGGEQDAVSVGAGNELNKSVEHHLEGMNPESSGLYRVTIGTDIDESPFQSITASGLKDNDVIFSNGMLNDFGAAVKNGYAQLTQAGMLEGSFVLNFNPTKNIFSDFMEASRDIVGAHTGWTHSQLARDLAGVIDTASANGVTGLHLVGHSQGGAITASALRYADKMSMNLSSLSGGGVALHGAPVNAWFARTRLAGDWGLDVVSRHQFGDAVHVFGGLNITNPLEIPIALIKTPALFSSDWSVSPHSLPCGGSTAYLCTP